MAKTKKDAHQQAAENALRSLAGKISTGDFSSVNWSPDCS